MSTSMVIHKLRVILVPLRTVDQPQTPLSSQSLHKSALLSIRGPALMAASISAKSVMQLITALSCGKSA